MVLMASARLGFVAAQLARRKDDCSEKERFDITQTWKTDPRWKGVERPYTAEDVDRLRGTVHVEHTLARLGAERLWQMMHEDNYVAALGAMTGNQAIEMVQAGLKAIYVSGWQVAGDANTAGQVYPDQSLYPVDSVPAMVRRINNALLRADQIHHSEGKNGTELGGSAGGRCRSGFRRHAECL